jgi:HEAT repeat protein
MNKRRYLLLGILVVAVAVVARWSISSLREPAYKGRRLGLWLAGYSSDHSSPEVDEAVRQMGTNCLPLLLRWLSAKHLGWTNQLGLPLPLLDARLVEVRRAQATQAFEALGEEAWAAVPALIEIYQQNLSTAPGRAAARALSTIGPSATNAVPFLLGGATNADPGVRVVAVGTLSQIVSAPEQVVPVLICSLNDPDQEVRDMAAFALACYRKEAKPAIPALLEKLKDPYHQVRGNAIWALAEAHAPAALAVPALTTALQDPQGFVRARAAQALGTFGAEAMPARKALIQLLSDPDQGVRDHVTQSLRSIDIDPEAAAREGL